MFCRSCQQCSWHHLLIYLYMTHSYIGNKNGIQHWLKTNIYQIAIFYSPPTHTEKVILVFLKYHTGKLITYFYMNLNNTTILTNLDYNKLLVQI